MQPTYWQARHGDGNGLCCPYCGSQRLKVKDTRAHRNTNRRRRICKACNQRFWTIEVISNYKGDIIDPEHPENY